MVKTTKSKEDWPVRWIPVAEIGIVWPEAQRPLNEMRVKEMVSGFNPDGLGVIAVAEKNGKGLYHPLDGQHRVEAVKLWAGKDQLMKAEVHTDVHTSKLAAERFLLLNNSKKPSALDHFRRAVEAGRTREVEIDRIVRSAGYRISGDPTSPKAIAAVAGVNEVFKRGADVLLDTLKTIADLWRDDADATNGIIIRGMGLVIATYGGTLDPKRLRDRISKRFSAGNLIGAARGQKSVLARSGPETVMWIVVHTYNQGLKPDAQLPLP